MAEVDSEAPQEGAETAEQKVARLESENKELRDENARRRIEGRQTKIVAEFGEDVAEFVPKDLPLEEAREYASKLKEKFAPANPPEPEAHEPPAAGEAAPEAPSPLAAVSQPSTGIPAKGLFTMDQIDEISQSDPTRAREIVASGNWDKG